MNFTVGSAVVDIIYKRYAVLNKEVENKVLPHENKWSPADIWAFC